MSTGDVYETYAAALQHDLVDLPTEATRVGIVRQPMGWFHAVVDENVPALGPPTELLEACKRRQEDLAAQGLCDEEAHNAAWEDVGFTEGYQAHLDESDEASAAVDDLVGRLRDGEDIALVCFEGENKRCHRHLLRERLQNRLG